MSRITSARAAAFLLALAAASLPLTAQTSADLSVLMADDPDPVAAGSSLVYTLTVSNEGPDSADSVTLDDPLPAGASFQSLASPAGWSCATPAVGAGGTVSCSTASFSPGSEVFTLTVTVDPGAVAGTILTNTATVASSTPDPHPGTESASTDTTVAATTTAISLSKTDSPDPVTAGANLSYTITASNNGSADLETATVTDTLPAGTAFVSLASPSGWTCSTPAVGGSGVVSCTAAPFVPGSAVFSLVVQVGFGVVGGSMLSNQASLDVMDSGRDTTQVATATTLVLSPAALSATKTVSGPFLQAGTPVTYTVVLTNSGPAAQGDNPGNELTDVLPSTLTLVSAAAGSGTTTATVATNTVTWNGPIPAGASVTITIHATINTNVAPGTLISNQATFSYDGDGDGANETNGVSDDPAVQGGADPTSFEAQGPDVAANVPTLGGAGLLLLALLLGMGGAVVLRRRQAVRR